MSLSVFSRIFMKKYLAVSAALAGFLSLFAVPSHAGISLGKPSGTGCAEEGSFRFNAER